MSYATKTTVPVSKTKGEIETILSRFKASQFMSGWSDGTAQIAFVCHGLHIRFVMKMPERNEKRFTENSKGKLRPAHVVESEWEQAQRSSWRALLLCIRAKLESVESGIETFEQAFLAQVVLPNGSTVGDWAHEALPVAYATRAMPSSLLALPAKGME